jgi:hypothetical protein
MTIDGSRNVLVVLNVLPALEERVVDWLLGRGQKGFTSFPVSGLSASHDQLSPAEQVAGQQRRRQFSVQISAAEIDDFLEDLERSLGAADIRYWVLPLMRSGTFDTGGRGPG